MSYGALPVSNKLVHSVNKIFFLLAHADELPLHTINLCFQTKQNKKLNSKNEKR